MEDPSILIGLAGTATTGLALASAALLKGWTQWLELRREALRLGRPAPPAKAGDLTALRERVRRLEAIADGAPG
jgi:hypothetical protein